MVARPERRGAPERNFEMKITVKHFDLGYQDSDIPSEASTTLYMGIRLAMEEIAKLGGGRHAIPAVIASKRRDEIHFTVVFNNAAWLSGLKSDDSQTYAQMPYDEIRSRGAEGVKRCVLRAIKERVVEHTKPLKAQSDGWDSLVAALPAA